MDYEPLKITCPRVSADARLFISVVNEGIDSRLEGFTKSAFKWDVNGRLVLSFHPDEIQILLRRLCEIYDADQDNEHVGLWIEDIMLAQYGYEVV